MKKNQTVLSASVEKEQVVEFHLSPGMSRADGAEGLNVPELTTYFSIFTDVEVRWDVAKRKWFAIAVPPSVLAIIVSKLRHTGWHLTPTR